MQKVTLYKFIRENGGVTVSPNKPADTEYTELYRLIADEGKVLTKDEENFMFCIDTDSSDGWYEVDLPNYIGEEFA